MNSQCPRCLSSAFKRIGHAWEFCHEHDVHQHLLDYPFFGVGVRLGEKANPESEIGRHPRTTVAYPPHQRRLKLAHKEQR